MARMERKITKLQRFAQERVHWAALDKEVLGLAPRLWIEVLDRKHRYATLLYEYWRRWELSDTRDHFFNWLDNGQGSLIDLPHAPRRLLDEWQVIYLRRDQQPLFRVRIDPETGRFHWEADGSPVTIPAHVFWTDVSGGGPEAGAAPCCGAQATAVGETGAAAATPREAAVGDLLRPVLDRACRRDRLLATAREQVTRAMLRGESASPRRLEELTRPLVEEGLLCQLCDPFYAERLEAATTPNGHAHLRAMPRLPDSLLPGLGWEDVLRAIDHDQGLHMKTPFPQGNARAEGKGIFVLDALGLLYCATKIRGVFHHSSFVRGHCVKVAGGVCIVDGWLQQLSPHSGHYQPAEEHVTDMINDWKGRGVDFARVEIKPYHKTK